MCSFFWADTYLEACKGPRCLASLCACCNFRENLGTVWGELEEHLDKTACLSAVQVFGPKIEAMASTTERLLSPETGFRRREPSVRLPVYLYCLTECCFNETVCYNDSTIGVPLRQIYEKFHAGMMAADYCWALKTFILLFGNFILFYKVDQTC